MFKVWVLASTKAIFASVSVHLFRWRLALLFHPVLYLSGPGFILSLDIQLLIVGFALYVELPKIKKG